MSDVALRVRAVSKRFKLYHRDIDRLKELLFKRPYHKEVLVNDKISFDLLQGETLGIIGLNGAGKSTLLKIIAGVLEPSEGMIERYGRITPLLELGTGFNPEFSGYDNIYFNGMMLGMGRDEISHKIDTIIAFSELGDYINEPVKTYSSGMVMRLAFSVAIHADPSVLIVDEALSVGDAYFQQKSFKALQKLKERDLSILFVSHDLNALKILCDRLLLLHRGRVVEMGDPQKVTNHYNMLIAQVIDRKGLRTISTHATRSDYGNAKATIQEVVLCDIHDRPCTIFASGQQAKIVVRFGANAAIDNLTVGILIRNKFGQDIFGTNTFYHDLPIRITKGESLQAIFAMALNIGIGEYTLTVALHSDEAHLHDCYHWIDTAATFQIKGIEGPIFSGLCRLDPKVEIVPFENI